uniref:C1q domain-containing protein n=1 Tax=Amphilophus citrinellus TaxID=61819 RepID=A0A3Q0R2W6_AMPCI
MVPTPSGFLGAVTHLYLPSLTHQSVTCCSAGTCPATSGGTKGDRGDMGLPGNPGRDGDKGAQGPQGLCQCKDGANGTNGTPGVKGDKGDRGDIGAQGVQGSMGLKGNQGDMGLMGPPGPCSPAIQSAFSACINQSFPVHNLPIPFPRILTNQQSHFNPRGIYTAPVNGTYIFSFDLAVASKPLKVGLFRNFYPVIKTTEATIPSTTSHQVVLHLSMGDEVWLQVKDLDTNGIYADTEYTSTFSGYLLPANLHTHTHTHARTHAHTQTHCHCPWSTALTLIPVGQ